MTRSLAAVVLAAATATMESGAVVPREPPAEARLDASSSLPRPEAYREWIWLSSGLGMSYGPDAGAPDDHPPFDNVFVTPAAYRSFLQTGRWPDGTTFVLEVRASESNGSINRTGFYQGALRGVEVEVKARGAGPSTGSARRTRRRRPCRARRAAIVATPRTVRSTTRSCSSTRRSRTSLGREERSAAARRRPRCRPRARNAGRARATPATPLDARPLRRSETGPGTTSSSRALVAGRVRRPTRCRSRL